jgi:DNA modification methylase
MQLDALPQPERVEIVDPETLTTDGDNPNEQSDEMFGLLCENMRQKGWLGNHIVADTDGLIADGEHRWRAAQEIGLEEVPVKFYDIDDAERRLWRQELNKISGDHDTKRDALEYDYLLNSGKSDAVNDLVSATDEDLDELLAEIKVDNSLPPQYEYDPEHNVYFEDCVEGMREKIGEGEIDCIVTDPPYGIDVDMQGGLECVNQVRDKGTVDNDQSLEETLDLFRDVLTEASRVVSEDGHLYVFASWKTYPEFATLITNAGFEVRNCLIWKKKNKNHTPGFVGDKPLYGYNHEFCIFAVAGGGRTLSEPQEDVLEYPEARFEDTSKTETAHPTQKPVGLLSRLIELSTSDGGKVLDPFMGSGTTAVAAIQNDRDYVGFELDEDNYRSVIERRIGEAKRQVSANQD